MKAKDILNICEVDNSLSGKDFYDILIRYFEKKFKSAGISVTLSGTSSVTAFIEFKEISDFFTVSFSSRKYLTELLDGYTRSNEKISKTAYGFKSEIFIPGIVNGFWAKKPILVSRVVVNAVADSFVSVVLVGFSPEFIEKEKMSVGFPEFSTDESLNIIYKTIDLLSTGMRLIPFELTDH